MLLSHLGQVYFALAVLFLGLPYITYYFSPKTLRTRLAPQKLAFIILYSVLFGVLFLTAEFFTLDSPWAISSIIRHPSEFFWINFFLLMVYLIFFDRIWDSMFHYSMIVESKLPVDALGRLAKQTVSKTNARLYHMQLG